MALYHLHVKALSRGAGRSATAAAAYRAAEIIHDERSQLTWNYRRRKTVDREACEILAPARAPEWARSRERLWNAVEAAERRIDGRVAREIEVALPIELTRDERIELVRRFAERQLVDKGMVADIAHHTNPGNPHAHILVTTREIDEHGFSPKKNRTWDRKDTLAQWRSAWADEVNKALVRAGRDERVDHRRLVEQGILRDPQIHIGVAAAAMERRGEKTVRGDVNRELTSPEAQQRVLEDTLEAMQSLSREECHLIYTGHLAHPQRELLRQVIAMAALETPSATNPKGYMALEVRMAGLNELEDANEDIVKSGRNRQRRDVGDEPRAPRLSRGRSIASPGGGEGCDSRSMADRTRDRRSPEHTSEMGQTLAGVPPGPEPDRDRDERGGHPNGGMDRAVAEGSRDRNAGEIRARLGAYLVPGTQAPGRAGSPVGIDPHGVGSRESGGRGRILRPADRGPRGLDYPSHPRPDRGGRNEVLPATTGAEWEMPHRGEFGAGGTTSRRLTACDSGSTNEQSISQPVARDASRDREVNPYLEAVRSGLGIGLDPRMESLFEPPDPQKVAWYREAVEWIKQMHQRELDAEFARPAEPEKPNNREPDRGVDPDMGWGPRR